MSKLLALFLAMGLCTLLPNEIVGSDGGKIVFLNLRMVKGAITLESVRIVDGKLKSPTRLEFYTNQIYFAVTSASNELLHQGKIQDPSKLRNEYADESGKLHFQPCALDSVTFSIRIPYDDRARTVEFFVVGDGMTSGAQVIEHGRRIGSVTIDMGEVRDE
jgi:hypothetical protein